MKEDWLKLSDKNISFLKGIWTDNAGQIRAKSIYKNLFKENHKYIAGISKAQQGIPYLKDFLVREAGVEPVGEVWLKPDWKTLQFPAYSPGFATVITDLFLDNKAWELCPRNLLKKAIKELKKLDYELKVSFENEFYLFKFEEDENKLIDNSLFASSYSYVNYNDFIIKLSDELENQGFLIERFYPESGPGQVELTFKYADPLEAADKQIYFKEITKSVAHMFEYRVSFMPKPFEEFAGSGTHIHLSLWKNGENLTGVHNVLSFLSKSFIEGVLDHLDSMMAVTTPTNNSFRRIKPNSWSGAYDCWGYNNREAAVRVPGDADNNIQNFEIKTVDGTSNPYIALALIIISGIEGIVEKKELKEPMQRNPSLYSEEELNERRIKRLPEKLIDSLNKFSEDNLFKSFMGEKFFNSYLKIKLFENKEAENFSIEEERKIMLERF
ncbi:MAG: glutamine synthetase [Kosmotogales bacterium]|nr:glutamine synthetase [Kosmotogales bacterium]